MYPDPLPKAAPAPRGTGAIWLNGTAWAIIGLGFAAAFTDTGNALIFALLVLPGVATLGAVLNLVIGLGLLLAGRQRQAWPYLTGFVPLALLAWWVLHETSHMGKLFGSG